MELNFGKYDKNYSHITKSSLDERKEALSMYIDKYLGPYEQRYFGAGHKRTQYEIIDTYISYKQFILVAKMTQKGIWSQKGTKKKNQHLSTIDSVILSTLLVDKYLEMVKENCSDWILKSFEVRSASQPVENVECIDLFLDFEKSSLENKKYAVNVSGMKVTLSFEQIDVDNQISKGQYNYFSSHLKYARHDLKAIDFASDDLVEGIIQRECQNQSYSGLGSAHAGEVSLLEYLVIFSQLCEILVYNHDKIDRKDSRNLWMRYIKAEINGVSDFQAVRAFAKVDRSKKIRKGDNWSMLDVSAGTTDNRVQFTAKLAHILPVVPVNLDQ